MPMCLQVPTTNHITPLAVHAQSCAVNGKCPAVVNCVPPPPEQRGSLPGSPPRTHGRALGR
eukprot:353161-Chlamydomonas_euryale.AAC.2